MTKGVALAAYPPRHRVASVQLKAVAAFHVMEHLLGSCTLAAAGAAAGVTGSGAGAGAAGFAVPLNLDGLVRPPARSISLVPANDVPARIAHAGKLQERLQFLG